MQSPVVVDRAGFAALLVQQVLREELVDRLIDRDFAVPPVLGEPVSADFCDEGSKRPCRLGLGVGLDGAVEATYSATCVPAGDGELPDARPDLDLGSSAAWRTPPGFWRRLAADREVLDADA